MTGEPSGRGLDCRQPTKAHRGLVSSLVALFLSVLAALLSVPPSAAAGSVILAVPDHAHEGLHRAAVLTYTSTESRPPKTYDRHTAYYTADGGSRGASVCPDTRSPQVAYTYNASALFARPVTDTTTTQGQGLGSDARFVAAQASQAAADNVVDACRANSFTGDTEILMADGTAKRIEDITVGDMVWATDPQTGEAGPRRVTDQIVGDGIKDLVKLSIDGDVLTATNGHPFWVPGRRLWMDAENLRIDDQLLLADVERVQVEAVSYQTEVRRVCNLTVAGIHTYYVVVNDSPVLVHNCPMLGANGTQVTSKTLTPGNRPYRVDVENPAPGSRPGQLHLQYRGQKYLYDFDAGEFPGLPSSLAKQIANDSAVARAVTKGRSYLGLQ